MTDAEPRVAASACARCERAWVPPRPRCPSCGGDVAPTEASAVGELLSWTVVNAAPEGMEPGYGIGVVQLPDARVVATAIVVTDLSVGSRVVVRDEGGRLTFRPAH